MARPHAGQMAAAAHLLDLLADSEIRESHREHDTRVQDAYCLRCMPQVHGAVRGVLEHVAGVLETEAGSATDNPLIFPQASPTARRMRCFRAGIFMARRWPTRSTMRRWR